MKKGNTIKTSTKYTNVANVPNSTHGYSAVSLPRKPKKKKFSVKNQKKRLYELSNTLETPIPQSIIGNK